MKNLEKIRAKCIEVNPAIEKQGGWVVVPAKLSQEEAEAQVYIPRPIRLADVLLAIREKNHSCQIPLEASPLLWYEAGTGAVALPSFVWNIRKDSLEDQSEETLAFISSILHV